jgi:hypothetical protein
MKTLTLALIFAVSLFHGSATFANDNDGKDTEVAIAQSMNGEKKAVIRVDNLVEEQKTLLKIKDEQGRVLHSEMIHQAPTFVRTYDFSGVKGNTYTVEVVSKAGKTRETFDINPSANTVYFKPVIKTESGVIKVVFQNPLESPVTVKLYDRYNHMIYEAKVNAQEIFAQGLDVSHLSRGQYDLSLTGTNYAYSKTISTR